jgi:hypothetical protein
MTGSSATSATGHRSPPPGTDSDHIYVHAPGSDTPALSWSPGGGPVTVDAKTGILTAPADTGESPIAVKFGTLSGTATAACAKPVLPSPPLFPSSKIDCAEVGCLTTPLSLSHTPAGTVEPAATWSDNQPTTTPTHNHHTP